MMMIKISICKNEKPRKMPLESVKIKNQASSCFERDQMTHGVSNSSNEQKHHAVAHHMSDCLLGRVDCILFVLDRFSVGWPRRSFSR